MDPLFLVLGGAVAAEAVALAYLIVSFRRHQRSDRGNPPKPNPAPFAAPANPIGTLQDVFLLHRSGLLLKHYTRRLRPNMDSDVLSGMLVAVQEFIKDSFRGEAGSLDEIRFVGGMAIKVLEGKWTIIAAVVQGESGAPHTLQMQAALKDLEARYEDLLIDWDGTMDRIPEVDRIMQRLIDGGYQEDVAQVAA